MTDIKPSGVKSSKIVDSGRARNILERFVADRNASILDVGCGVCSFLGQLKERGYVDITGLEALDYPRVQDVNVASANLGAERLPWSDAAYDAVTAWEVMEHLENPYFALREIHRILKPGGTLIFSMPNAFHWSNKIYFLCTGNFLRWNKKNDHRTIFTHDVCKKAYAGYFDLAAVEYSHAEFWQAKFRGPFRRLNGLFRNYVHRLLPESRMFSHFIVYVLKKR